MSNSQLYDRDFYAWANEQAALLRARQLTDADLENIAEELESMGRGEKRELINRLTVLMLHLLKWQHQPSHRGNSWRNTIEIQRISLDSHMHDNPSLKSVLPATMAEAYRVALIEAATQTGLAKATFPSSCQWTFEQIMRDDFWPE